MSLRYTLFLSILFNSICLLAQTPDSIKTVQLVAETQEDAAQIQLSWYDFPNVNEYLVYKKDPETVGFGSAIATLPAGTTEWVDTNVQLGQLYHYRVLRRAAAGDGWGYITAGMKTHVEGIMGRIILAMDTSLIELNNAHLETYTEDLINEGWTPVLLPVPRDTTAAFVKSRIRQLYNQAPAQTRALVLIGHVPVPYAGELNPDGHNNHRGAWPADTYYADMDGQWTDQFVNNTSASWDRNHNVPGDGKFDQSIIPYDNNGPDNYAELETGRIDFANLNTFSESELELLEQYFQKNHAFRTNQIRSRQRGLIENNFRSLQEGFGQNGLRDFATFFGRDSVFYRDYDNLKNEPYLWSYACGGGNFNGASGINNASSMANDSIQAIFTMHFGSYFGDWDHGSGNYLRAALGSGTILTNAWVARPNWPNYFMASGKTIGYVTKMAMSNPGNIHDTGFGNRWVHIALMGDPTLRMHVSGRPLSLGLAVRDSGIAIQWTPHPEAKDGYFVYVRKNGEGAFQQLNTEMLTDTLYMHRCPDMYVPHEYMIRAAKLQETGSGTYYKLSPGIRDTITSRIDHSITAAFSHRVSDDTLFLTNLAFNSDTFYWDFGDGNTSTEYQPTHIYSSPGEYTLTFIASNACNADTNIITVYIVPSSNEYASGFQIELYPNPFENRLNIEVEGERSAYQILDMQGRPMQSGRLRSGKNELDLSLLSAGTYIISVKDMEKGAFTQRMIIKMNE